MDRKWIFWLEELGQEHNNLVGKKSANLGEIKKIGLPVPPGFVISINAYDRFMIESKAIEEIQEYLAKFGEGPYGVERLQEASNNLRKIVESKKIPRDMEEVIILHYNQLCKKSNISDMPVSTRSAGATSRPGQYETYLNVRGVLDLLEKIVKVWASSFNLRSLTAQIREGKLLDKNPISVCILKMVNTRAAGVAFTADPTTGDSSKIIIEANWGLGESVVSGNTTPDRFVLEKQSLKIQEKKLGQKTRCVMAGSIGVCEEEMPFEKVSNFCLNDEEVIKIGKLGKILEEHFNNTPQDLEWAIDAELPSANNVILLQTRPAIVAKKKNATEQILDQMLRCLYGR